MEAARTIANGSAMHARIVVLIAGLVCTTVAAQAQAPQQPAVPSCSSNTLRLATDAEGGQFNGMSQSGTVLVLRNVSSAACALNPFAKVVLKDGAMKTLDVTVDTPNPFRGPTIDGRRLPMGHGPVVRPIVLAAGAEATTTLHWITGPVFDHSICVDPAFLSLDLAGSFVQTALPAHICGPDAAHIVITTTGRLGLDQYHGR